MQYARSTCDINVGDSPIIKRQSYLQNDTRRGEVWLNFQVNYPKSTMRPGHCNVSRSANINYMNGHGQAVSLGYMMLEQNNITLIEA